MDSLMVVVIFALGALVGWYCTVAYVEANWQTLVDRHERAHVRTTMSGRV